MKKLLSFSILFIFLFVITIDSSWAWTKKSYPYKSKRIQGLPANWPQMVTNWNPNPSPGIAGLSGTVVFGAAPNCIGSGLCNNNLLSATTLHPYYLVDNDSDIFYIGFAHTDISNGFKSQLSLIQGNTFSFDANWPIVSIDAKQPMPELPFSTIGAGAYPIFDDGNFYVICIGF